MAYCAQADITKQLPESVVIQLSDDDGEGEVNTEVLNRAIADADAVIDAFCASTESVPFTTVPATIRKTSVDLTIYNLFSRRHDVPEIWRDRQKAAINFLTRVSDGKISLGSDAPTPDEDGGPECSKLESDRAFTIGGENAGTAGTLDNF